MIRVFAILSLAVGLAPLVLTAPAEEVKGFAIQRVDDLVWQMSAEFPGVEFAVMEGNLTEPGLYVIRARFAPGAKSAPHFHSEDRLVTVISGIWYAGVDASGDMDRTIPLYPGDFMKHPRGAVHFDGAKDIETIVEISGLGPVTSTAVEPQSN